MLLSVRGSEIVDVELSHGLAEEWLREFRLDDVIEIQNLEEAEKIVEKWIKEFRMGRENTENELDSIKKSGMDHKDYKFDTNGTDSAVINIDEGVAMIKRGTYVE